MKSSNEDAVELALAALLDVLAPILVPLDITPSRLGQIARISFVKASANHARIRSSGRLHLARIAALTGLSRAEVKRVVSANYRLGPREPENSTRALRVLGAWQTSKGYSRVNRASSLRVVGPFPSFETLCRDHSGDIPHKVILTELERRHRVRFSKNRTWVSVAQNPKPQISVHRELSNLAFVASLLGELSQSGNVLVRRKEKIGASSTIQDSYVESAIASRVTALMDSLPQTFDARKNKRKNTARVHVYTLVAKIQRARK